jgi:hypothetical protein
MLRFLHGCTVSNQTDPNWFEKKTRHYFRTWNKREKHKDVCTDQESYSSEKILQFTEFAHPSTTNDEIKEYTQYTAILLRKNQDRLIQAQTMSHIRKSRHWHPDDKVSCGNSSESIWESFSVFF